MFQRDWKTEQNSNKRKDVYLASESIEQVFLIR